MESGEATGPKLKAESRERPAPPRGGENPALGERGGRARAPAFSATTRWARRGGGLVTNPRAERG